MGDDNVASALDKAPPWRHCLGVEERALLHREIKAVAMSLGAMGVDLDAVSARAGFNVLNPSSAGSKDDSYRCLWGAVTEVDEDPTFPLSVGDGVAFGTYEVMDFLASSSPDVGHGLAQVARYFRLITSSIEWEVDAEAELPTVSIRDHHLEPRDHLVSHLYSLGVTFGRFRRLTRGSFHFAGVVLSMPPPPDPTRLETFFGCPIRYTRDAASEVRLTRPTWHLPLERAEPALARVLERHADTLVAQLGRADDPLRPIRDAISTSLSEGPRLEEVAKRVAMSPRTLQRRLREAGTTFQGLVDEARRFLAQGYLEDDRLTVGEVAYMLGYSEPSAFVRAFKRWTGRTPRQFRTTSSMA